MMNTNKRKTSRQVRRAVNAQVFEENAAVLALLSQQQDEEVTPNNCENDEDENEFYEFSDSESQSTGSSPILSTHKSSEPCQTGASTSELHQYNDENNIPGATSSFCFNHDDDNDCSNLSQNEQVTLNNSPARDESNGSISDSELSEDCSTPEDPEKIETFFVKQNDFSPEVWRIIKGGAEEKTQEELLKIELAQWSFKYNVKRNALDDLLHLLRHHGHSELPACAKTLLRTPRSTTNIVRVVAGGLFWYQGIETALLNCLSKEYVQSLQCDTLNIDIFVDGISPHKRAKRSIWPIAGCLQGEKVPFVIALWCGGSKEPTSVDAFFEEFLNESEHLIADGFLHHGRRIKLRIGRFMADAPARAWIKKVKVHNSYNSCERCTIVGDWKFRRMTFNPAEVCSLRTDESFEKQTDKDHHTGVSPLLRIGTNMISQIPLDVMHLVYLGVSRRLHALLLQTKAGRFKLSDKDVEELDSLCLFLYKFCPSDFVSKPRQLSQYKLYNAKEWRRILLYDGFLVNRSHKQKEVYECYLLIACAMRILLDSKMHSEFIDDAHQLLVQFVKRSYRVLGSSFVVYNVHHLLHLVADCRLHGNPEDFSCFKYESHLGHLKQLLAAPGKTLQQIVCRLIERSLAPAAAPAVQKSMEVSKPHKLGPMTQDCNGDQYNRAHFEDFNITVARDNPRDAVVLLSSKKVVVVENIVHSNSSVCIIGRQFLNMSDYFGFPLPSSVLNIFKVSNLGPLKKWSKSHIMKKVYYFPLVNDGDFESFDWREGEGLCIPILHTEV